jgi:hypothetical protein
MRQHQRTRFLGLVLFCLAACGSPTNDSEVCSFEVVSEGVATQSASKLVSLVGTMPAQCATLTTENSGRLTVQISLAGPKDPNIVLQSAEAGDRSKSFDPVGNNLRAGSLDTRFSSQTEPAWAVPWADSPSRFNVALAAPLSASDESLPSRATVRLVL